MNLPPLSEEINVLAELRKWYPERNHVWAARSIAFLERGAKNTDLDRALTELAIISVEPAEKIIEHAHVHVRA